MSVKVISVTPTVKQCLCKGCGALLEYTKADVKTEFYSVMCEPAGSSDYVDCPNCKGRVTVRSR